VCRRSRSYAASRAATRGGTSRRESTATPRSGPNAQTTNTLGLANGRPQQVLSDPYPAINPVQEEIGQSLGRYTGLGNGRGGNVLLAFEPAETHSTK